MKGRETAPLPSLFGWFSIQGVGENVRDLFEGLAALPGLRDLASQFCLFHKAIDGGSTLQHLWRQAKIGEGARDLLHLTNPTIRLWWHRGYAALEHAIQDRLAALEFGGEGIAQAQRFA